MILADFFFTLGGGMMWIVGFALAAAILYGAVVLLSVVLMAVCPPFKRYMERVAAKSKKQP